MVGTFKGAWVLLHSDLEWLVHGSHILSFQLRLNQNIVSWDGACHPGLKGDRLKLQLVLEEHKLILDGSGSWSTEDSNLNHISEPQRKAPQTQQFTKSFWTSGRVQVKKESKKFTKDSPGVY